MRPFFTAFSASIALLAYSGPASAQADALGTAVDAVFAGYGEDIGPACAVAVSSDGRMQYSRGYGFASLEHGAPITPETVFDIGSVSKQFTAAAVAVLVQEGRVSLDDSVRTYLP